jgi:hypothetical protein
LEVVCSAARVGNSFLGGRCGARDIVGISLGVVWRLSRSLMIAVVVVVGRVGVDGELGAVLREHGRLGWMLAAGGCGS